MASLVRRKEGTGGGGRRGGGKSGSQLNAVAVTKRKHFWPPTERGKKKIADQLKGKRKAGRRFGLGRGTSRKKRKKRDKRVGGTRGRFERGTTTDANVPRRHLFPQGEKGNDGWGDKGGKIGTACSCIRLGRERGSHPAGIGNKGKEGKAKGASSLSGQQLKQKKKTKKEPTPASGDARLKPWGRTPTFRKKKRED